MTFKPDHDRVLILPDEDINTIGSFVLPDGQKVYTGTIIAVGEGIPLHNVKLEIKCDMNSDALEKLHEIVMLLKEGRKLNRKEGDRVMWGQYAGTSITIDGKRHIIVRDYDIFGKIY